MSRLLVQVRRSTLPILIVLCLAALTVSYAFADGSLRPLATQVIGDPDAAVAGKFAVGTVTPGNKALTVVGVIDFLGSGTVHNYFTQGGGNNMQINTNVDETNTVGDATKSQWKLVVGSSLDWFSIRRSPASGTYNEDALFFIEGSTGNVGIATVDTNNNASIPFTPQARLHVETAYKDAVWGVTSGNSPSANLDTGVTGWATATSGITVGAGGESDSTSGRGVMGYASATSGTNHGVYGWSRSTDGRGVYGRASATQGGTYGVYGESASTSGVGVLGWATATTDNTFGVEGLSVSSSGIGVFGSANSTSGYTKGVSGASSSPDGIGVQGTAVTSTGYTYGVFGEVSSSSGTGVAGVSWASTGGTSGVYGQSNSTGGRGVYGVAAANSGVNFGVYGHTFSTSGYGVYFEGGLAGTGTKSAIVDTEHYGWRHLYAMESPQNWFEDFGQATLTAGEAVVTIESVFAETVNLEKPYHVFLTPLGQCALYVADKSPGSFTVRALEGSGCEIAFDYRIIAPRLDYEDLRLKEAESPQAVAASLPEAPAAP